jgi:predicted transcriptional regulator
MRRALDLNEHEDISSTTLLLSTTIKRALRDRAVAENRSQSEIARTAILAYLNRFS